MESKPCKKQQSSTAGRLVRLMAFIMVLISAVLLGSQAVQAAPAKGEKFVLVLDAGHGGKDPGAVDPANGFTEAELVQTMALRLASYFEKNADEVEVVLTRDSDNYIGINQRAAIANGKNADLFVSLHLNAAENPDARGFQIFPAPPGRTHHAESLQASEDILQHVRQLNQPVMGINGVYYAYYQGGEKIFYDANEYNRENSLGTFGVLDNADCPAILVEQWFITNAEDMAVFNNATGQDLMARQLYRGICDYIGVEQRA